MMDDRGLIFLCDRFDADERLLRAWLLFWDELVAVNPPDQWPDHPWGHAALQRSGIVSRMPVGTGRFDAVLSEQSDPLLVAFSDLEAQSPGKWSVAPVAPGVRLPSNAGRTVLVRLYQALPVPSASVPIEAVLEFRARRRDEQLALRAHIEQIYDTVIRSPDVVISLDVQLRGLASAVADAATVMEEARMPFRFAGIDATLSWSFDVTPAVVGAAIGAMASPALALAGAGAGAIANLMPKIEIASGVGFAPPRKAPKVPFAYVIRFNEEFGESTRPTSS